MNIHVCVCMLTRSCHFELFLFLFVREFFFKYQIIHFCQLYLVHINMERILWSPLIYMCFYIQHANYSIQCFFFLRVAFSIFICKSGYMYEQEQSEKKYIYYTCFIPLFLLLQYIALVSQIIFPLDNVSDYVSLNYFCDHICITFYISIELLKPVVLSK